MERKIIESRVKMLKAMHTLICGMNDETAYEHWVYIIPDCPDEDDFLDCAEDEEIYEDACKTFRELVKIYGKSGFYASGDSKAF